MLNQDLDAALAVSLTVEDLLNAMPEARQTAIRRRVEGFIGTLNGLETTDVNGILAGILAATTDLMVRMCREARDNAVATKRLKGHVVVPTHDQQLMVILLLARRVLIDQNVIPRIETKTIRVFTDERPDRVN